ncbi:TfoX/Sxy family protein [Bacillus sp. NP157]|nr:TfoX/Sxy family protein [Bacillus sp. NP157]
MGSQQRTADFILDQLSSLGKVSAKKMFGEYAIYHGEKVIALIADDQLFVKPTDGGKAFLGKWEEGLPYPGAKPCILVPGDKWDDRDWLSKLMIVTASELPVPKKKVSKK